LIYNTFVSFYWCYIIDNTKQALNERISKLGTIELFSGISTEALSELADLMKKMTFKKNEVIITQGDKTRSLFIITSGRMKVYANDEDGSQTIFTFLTQGSFFGELSLLDDAPRSASVIAVESSTALNLSHQNFNIFLSSHPEICPSLFKALTARIRKMDDTICTLTSRDIYGRLVQALYNQATEQDDGTLITQRLTHQDLADMIGSSREMISRIFKDLKKGEYISIEKKRVIIHKQLPTRW